MRAKSVLVIWLVIVMIVGVVPAVANAGVSTKTEGSGHVSPTSSRTVFLETFTATWCPPCVYETQALHDISGEFTRDKLVIVEWHTNDGFDPVDGSKSERYKYYGVTGIPTVVFDGGNAIIGASSKQQAYDDYKNQIYSHMGILGTVTVSQNSTFIGMDVFANITIDAEQKSGQYNVRILLIDNLEIIDANHNVDWVVRKTIKNENVTLSAGKKSYVNGTTTIDAKWNKGKLYTAAFVQDYAGKNVLNANITKLAYGGGVDKTPPTISNVQRQPLNPKETDKVKITADVIDNAFVDNVTLVYDNGTGQQTAPMDPTGSNYAATVGPFPANATLTYHIEAKDDAGNGAKSPDVSVNILPIDKIPPAISNVKHTPASPTNLDKVTISSTIIDNEAVSSASVYYNDGTGIKATTMTGSGSDYSAQIGPFLAGMTVKYHVEARDAMNNLGKSPDASFPVKAPDTTAPSIDNVQFLPANPTSSDLVNISAVITDDTAVDSATLSYDIGGGPLTVSMMKGSGDTYFAKVGAFATDTIVHFNIEAKDPTGNIGKSPDSSFKVLAAKYPDVSVKDISISPSSPKVGDEVTISAQIVNLGTGDAKDINVTFSVAGTLITTKKVASLGAGSSTIVTATWKVDKEGERKITVEATAAGDPKSDNNVKDLTINAIKSTADLTQMVVWAIPIVVIAVIVVVILMLMRKRKRAEPVQPAPIEEKKEEPKKAYGELGA